MNLHYFAVLLLIVLTVNGSPKPDPKPSPKADPKPKAQMAIIFNNKKHGGDMGMPRMGMPLMENREGGLDFSGYGEDYNDGAYGDDYTGDYGDYAGYDNGHG